MNPITSVQETPEQLQNLFQEAFQHHQQSRWPEAKAGYEKILQVHGQHFNCLHMLGVLEAQTGNPLKALEYLQQALQINPQAPAVLGNYGNALNDLKRWQEALPFFQQALALDPNMINAQYAQGIAHYQLGDYAQAQQSFQQVLSLQPDYMEAMRYLIQTYYQSQQTELAIQTSEQLLARLGKSADSYLHLAHLHYDLKNYAYALSNIEQALALDAQLAGAHSLKGLVLMGLNQPLKAQPCLQTALQLNANDIDVLSNLGLTMQELQHLPEAIDYFDQALALAPDHAEVQFNKSLALLLSGDFTQGWQLFESRRRLAPNPQPLFEQPLWLGDFSLQDKTILVYSEQGLGDTIQFSRYIPRLSELGAKVIFAVPKPLLRLMAQVPGVLVLASEGQVVPKFDCHCPLMSLPLAFNTQPHDIPASAQYLQSYSLERKRLLDALGVKTKPRIGLVWSGRPEHGNDVNRSIALADLLAILPQGAEYISLQKEVRDSDLAALQASPIVDMRSQLNDFTDTAGLCDCIDLLLTVDTSVAHLAAAMGRQTYMLLPYNPDYRWLLHRTDSPWYPSVKLYRQQQHGDWSATWQQLQQDLSQWIEAQSNQTQRIK